MSPHSKVRARKAAPKLTKNELRAMRWIDETGTGDMAANQCSTTEECNERLAMMRRTLTAEFDAVEKARDEQYEHTKGYNTQLLAVAAAAVPFLKRWGTHSGSCCIGVAGGVIVTEESCKCDPETKALRRALQKAGVE